ncbi:MAG: hypothetical protein WB867_08525 [Candidatus Dormiibacterota bacterium]
MAADVTRAAAKSPAFPSATKQRQLFRQWEGNQGSNLLNENPELAEALGSSQYSTGAPVVKVSYGRTTYYKLIAKAGPESFLAVSEVTTSVASKPTRSSVLVIFDPRPASIAGWPSRRLLCLSVPISEKRAQP